MRLYFVSLLDFVKLCYDAQRHQNAQKHNLPVFYLSDLAFCKFRLIFSKSQTNACE